MADIKSVIDELLKRDPFVSPVDEGDKALFQQHFVPEVANLPIGEGYGYSWAYITQMIHGHVYGYPLGLKYYSKNKKLLIPIGFFPRPASNRATWHFHLVRPMGNWQGNQIMELCSFLWEISQTPVYIKKLTHEEASYLLGHPGFVSAEKYPWDVEAILEDDTKDEVIINVNHTVSHIEEPGDNELKRKYRRFRRRNPSLEWKHYDASDTRLRSDAESVVRRFMEYPQIKNIGISTFVDYINMISSLPPGMNGEDFFSALLYIGGQPIGFYLAERLGNSQTAGVYANIALREEYPFSSEYLLLELLRDIQRAGITAVNMGGSENEGLHEFKLKFQRSCGKVNKMYWVAFTGKG